MRTARPRTNATACLLAEDRPQIHTLWPTKDALRLGALPRALGVDLSGNKKKPTGRLKPSTSICTDRQLQAEINGFPLVLRDQTAWNYGTLGMLEFKIR